MADETPIAQAQALLDELLDAAKTGALIPVRLPGQIEAIKEALSADGDDGAAPAASSADLEAYQKEQAEFMSIAIHELRVPMTSIRGYADMMGTMGELDDMQKQFLETIRNNARRMEGLLKDVSDISKLRGGTLQVKPTMDMFKNIAMRVEKDMMPVAEEMGRTLTFDMPQGLPLLNTDGDLMAKAIGKLVENALRYTKEDGVVTVRGEGEGNLLRIIIEDNGIGMSPEDMAQLGTLYFRSDDDYVREYKGSGLGVPIAYGITELLGGTVQVNSSLGEGTSFTLTFEGMS